MDKLERDSKFDLDYLDTLIICLCYTESGCLCMHTAHMFSSKKEPIEMLLVDSPTNGENYKAYEAVFLERFTKYRDYFNNFVILKYDNSPKTAKSDFEWVKDVLISEGISEENIITAALFERSDSRVLADLVGCSYKGTAEFWFQQKHNKRYAETRKDQE